MKPKPWNGIKKLQRREMRKEWTALETPMNTEILDFPKIEERP